jgi:glutamate synthase (NADPH/NADH) small chain
MGKPTGFKEFDRSTVPYRAPGERLLDYKEIYTRPEDSHLTTQGARCMDCGVPFCQSDNGCPVYNLIPEWNDLVYKGQWREALDRLHKTNNFPEFTGRVCPAPCEGSCVLGMNNPPVTIKNIENAIIDRGFENGWVVATPPIFRTGKKVAVIGSGPAGLAAAAQLNQAGHSVTVYEREDRIGGLLMYGIPNMKLDKQKVVMRRLNILEQEGVKFVCNTEIGKDLAAEDLLKDFDAVVLCTGATKPRDLSIEGRELKGIHFAMEFLGKQNQVIGGEIKENPISAKGKNILVIGGGDTGSDCIGTSNRHGANTITQLELLPKPPAKRTTLNPWPEWPMTLKTSSSHEEGAERLFSVLTKEFIGNKNNELTGLKISEIIWKEVDGKQQFEEVPGTEKTIACDLAFLAIGYTGPAKNGLVEAFGIELMENSMPKSKNYQSGISKIFLAGDMRRGQSLVVWAISEGREAAVKVDEFLQGYSNLPKKDASFYHVEEPTNNNFN